MFETQKQQYCIPYKTKRNSEKIKKILDEMVWRIVKRFNPEQIILFGSYACGTSTSDSDIDLLIVMPVLESKREKRIEIRLALCDIHIPKDIIVVTPNDLRKHRNIPGTIVQLALFEGKVLYAQNE